MNKKWIKRPLILLVLLGLVLVTTPVLAQTYAFQVDREVVDVYWESDGTVTLTYELGIINENYADPMEFIDISMPTTRYSPSNASATVNGQTITHIAESAFVDNAIELGLGGNAIQPGAAGTVFFQISGIGNVLYEDSQDDNYASGVFSPSWFESDFVTGTTDLTVIYHFPPGLAPEEPRWHEAPSGFPSEPETGFDDAGRITYTWRNPNANAYTQYLFGSSFPMTFVPPSTVAIPTFWQNIGIDPEALMGFGCICGVGLMFILIPILSIRSSQKRKMKYLPPKLAIEGHGIKRGLTAVEAAILLEQPMDKILTMIMFATIKKGAARVVRRDPLDIELIKPLPKDLREYEREFLIAMAEEGNAKKKRALQTAMVNLVKSVSKSMKGFSQRESKNYYEKIMEAAWKQVEDADTPEVKSETYDKVMEWTMLDDNYDDRTRRTFQNFPVFLPTWWHNYDSRTYGGSTPSIGKQAPRLLVPPPAGQVCPNFQALNLPGQL